MKTIYMLSMLILFIPINAQAGEWTLWKELITLNIGAEEYLPLSEHKSLNECLMASKKEADSTLSWATSAGRSIKSDSIHKTFNPDGVIYTSAQGYDFSVKYSCLPYGKIPSR